MRPSSLKDTPNKTYSSDSSSITDIYGAVHIDQVLIQQCPIVPQNYKRYRDDTVDVCRNSSREEQKCITDWMNENIEKDKIKFSIECIGEEAKFLDTKVNVVNISKDGEEKQFLFVPSMCSKNTDTHQYLSTKSCHPDHIAENIPRTVVHRCRTNRSDKVEDDSIFKETLVEYKAFLLKSGYPEENSNKKFIDFAIKKKR